MNERMKRILALVKDDIQERTADIEYQKMDDEKKQADRDLKNLKPKAPRLANMSNLMVGNE
jgi:hypothetical protein